MATRTRMVGCRAVAVLLVALTVTGWSVEPAAAVVSDDADLTWMTNGTVTSILVTGDRIYIGGTFTQVRAPGGAQTAARNNAAAINRLTGTVDETWNPNANGEVAALATDGNFVFAGGTFSAIGGRAKNRLAALDPVTGAAVEAWTANANAKVYSLAAAGGRVFAGGSFTSINNGTGATARQRLAALDAGTGGLVPGWTAAASAYVRAVEMSADGTRLFVGGDFTTISGSAHNRIAAVGAVSGAVDEGFQANGEYLVFDLAATPTALYAAIGGPGGRVSSYRTDTGVRNWRVSARGDVQAVAVDGATVYAGGHFTGDGEFAGVARWRLAAVGTDADLDQSFVPELSGQVWALATEPGRLYAGGDFVRINGRVQQGFARFSEPDPPDVPPDTSITAGPVGTVAETSATFAFTATEPSTFACQLDGTGLVPCASPVVYPGVADGSHTFAVRATDLTGNPDPTPATRTWTVDTSLPPPGPITAAGWASSGSPNAQAAITIARPAGTQAGYVMVAAVVINDDDPGFTAPAGWALVREDVMGTVMRQAIYVRVATASEPAAYTWTLSTSRRVAGGITAYAGVDTAVPVDVHGAQVNAVPSTALVAPSVTTTVPNTLLVHVAAVNAEGTISPPAGMTERWEATAPRANSTRDVTTSSSDLAQATAGPAGAHTATATQPGGSIGALLALRPASSI